MCSDWSKKDAHGEAFGEYYRAPVGSFEHEHAYELSRRNNILCLYRLPWPLSVLFETIDIGCRNRHECVSYSNFIAEWVWRKHMQLTGTALARRDVVMPANFNERAFLGLPAFLGNVADVGASVDIDEDISCLFN